MCMTLFNTEKYRLFGTSDFYCWDQPPEYQVFMIPVLEEDQFILLINLTQCVNWPKTFTIIWIAFLIIPLSCRIRVAFIPYLHCAVAACTIIRLPRTPVEILWSLMAFLPYPCSFVSKVRKSNPVEDILIQQPVNGFFNTGGLKLCQVSSSAPAVLNRFNKWKMFFESCFLPPELRPNPCAFLTPCSSRSLQIRSIQMDTRTQWLKLMRLTEQPFWTWPLLWSDILHALLRKSVIMPWITGDEIKRLEFCIVTYKLLLGKSYLPSNWEWIICHIMF